MRRKTGGRRSGRVLIPTSLRKERGDRGFCHDLCGRAFCALQKETVLSGVLGSGAAEIDGGMVRLGARKLREEGFNRAIQIGHIMNMLHTYGMAERKSYLEA
jgi:hypothetical protein